MNADSCCVPTGRSSGLSRERSSTARHAAEWGTPALILLLLPKCPMCMAAYVAMFTGVGITFSAAASLHETVILLCFATMALLFVRTISRRHDLAS